MDDEEREMTAERLLAAVKKLGEEITVRGELAAADDEAEQAAREANAGPIEELMRLKRLRFLAIAHRYPQSRELIEAAVRNASAPERKNLATRIAQRLAAMEKDVAPLPEGASIQERLAYATKYADERAALSWAMTAGE